MQLTNQLIQTLDLALEGTRAPEVPGAAVAILSPDGDWFGASGLSNVAENTPLQAGDRFEAGSITKTFIATTILQLVEENQLSLDDTLTDWLSSDLIAQVPNASEITLKQLLNHTSGIADYLDVFVEQARSNPILFTQDWQPEQLVGFLAGVEPFFAPGESWQYSNTNYILAGSVIEAVTGNGYGQEIRDRILDPLNLQNSFIAGEEEIPGGYIKGYWDFDANGTLDDLSITNLSWAGSAGSLISNTADLAAFFDALLQDKTLLGADALAQMLDTIPVDSPNYDSYGLGIGTLESPNRFWYAHRGQTLGFRSNLWYSPAEDITYVELTNGRSDDNLVGDLLPTFRNGLNSSGENLIYSESANGDISNNPNAPLAIALAEGTNTLSATSGNGDQEYVTVTVPEGFELSSLVLESYAPNDVGFIGVQEGTTFAEPLDDSAIRENILGYTLFGNPQQIGTDILDEIGNGLNAQGFSGSLPSGDYTFALQQLGAESDYTLAFNVSESVTEPPIEPPAEPLVLFGDNGDNRLMGDRLNDTIAGRGGNDIITGEAGDDVLRGDDNSRDPQNEIGGNDIIFGGEGRDRIGGKGGNDILSGDEGDDFIWGGSGDDFIMGGSGNDILVGDNFSGGSGSDLFVFGNGDGTDTLLDFEVGTDKIGLVEGELSLADLTFVQSGLDILLGMASTNDTLAVINNVQVADLNESSFSVVANVSNLEDALMLV